MNGATEIQSLFCFVFKRVSCSGFCFITAPKPTVVVLFSGTLGGQHTLQSYVSASSQEVSWHLSSSDLLSCHDSRWTFLSKLKHRMKFVLFLPPRRKCCFYYQQLNVPKFKTLSSLEFLRVFSFFIIVVALLSV